MFWHGLYEVFCAKFPSADRGLFSLLMTCMVLKTVQSVEAASVNDVIPPCLWEKIFSHFAMCPHVGHTYAELYMKCLPISQNLRRFRGIIGCLDHYKFNLIPYCFNRVDVAMEIILPRRYRHWKCYLWLVVFARRFCNNAALLLAVVHYLHLRKFSASVSEDLIVTSLSSFFTEL